MSTHLLYNYLITIFYNLRKQPVFAAIKVFSLTLGLVCALLVLAHVQYIFSYDRHFPNWQNIYRVVASVNNVDYNQTAFAYAEPLAQDYEQMNHVTRVRPDTVVFSRTTSNSAEVSSNNFFWVDPSVIDLFSLVFVQGDRTTALTDANSIVLSETTARKYFGDQDPIGEVLTYDNRSDLQVTGVMRDLPVNTYLQIEAMISFETGRQVLGSDFMISNNPWLSFAGSQTFFSVPNSAEAASIANDLDGFIDRNITDAQRVYAEEQNLNLSLESLSEVYLSPRVGYNSGGPIRKKIFYGLVVFALLILLTSCVNFANLSMSQLRQRSKEIGVRKAVGANRGQIIFQFLFESLVLTLIALIVTIPLVQATVPVYNSLTDTAFTFGDMLHLDRLVWLILFVLVTGLLAGFLPALTMSRLQPASIMKGIGITGRFSQTLRSAITIFQFSLSGTLVILAIGIVFIINHLNDMDIGFNRFDLVILDNQFTIRERRADYQLWETKNNALINDLIQHPGIVSVAESTVSPPTAGWLNPWGRLLWPDSKTWLTSTIGVDENYIETMQLQLIAGRGFSQDFPADFMSGARGDVEQTYAAVITRSALSDFEFESPEQALGEILRWGTGFNHRIVGVVEDIRFVGGLEDSQRSTSVLWATKQPGFYTILRINPLQTSNVLEHIDSVWARHRPDTPVNRRFFEQTYERLVYDRTNGINKASLFASLITISIAAMGLYALAFYSSQRRTKEVGVRKALGATSQSIIGLLTWDFIKPVIIACLISLIAGYLAVAYFFAQFSSYPVIPIWVYMAVAGGTILLAVLTVSAQCFKAASANPVHSLRCD